MRVALAACSVLAACSDDQPDNEPSSSGSAGGSAVVYALMIRDPDSITDYVMAGQDVPTGTIDASRGIELPGGDYYSDGNALLYANFQDQTMQRYEVGDDYRIELAGEFSLAKYGGAGNVLFFSPTRAFTLIIDEGVVVEFDPIAMEITREIEVPELAREGLTGEINNYHRVGDRLLAAIMYTGLDFDKVSEDSTVAIAIDGDSDEPVRVLRDERAIGADSSFLDEDGNFYALADGVGGYFSLIEKQSLTPTLIRTRRDAEEIDADYLLDLGELLDTPAVNGLWPLKDSRFVVQAWASEVDPADVLEGPEDLDVQPYWDWFVVDAKTRETEKLTGLARGVPSYSLLRFEVDGQLYLQQYVVKDGDYDNVHVELYQIGEDAQVKRVAETKRGDIRSIIRVKTSS